jgi:hypothetical protein
LTVALIPATAKVALDRMMEVSLSKVFTLGEAQTLVPVLGALVRRAREEAVRANELDNEMQELSQRIFLSGGLHVDVAAAARRRAEKDKAVQSAKSTIEEIEEIGASISDLSEGALEVPSSLEGRPVLLCWSMGETEITHWREPEDESSVRREVDGRFGRGERLN